MKLVLLITTELDSNLYIVISYILYYAIAECNKTLKVQM